MQLKGGGATDLYYVQWPPNQQSIQLPSALTKAENKIVIPRLTALFVLLTIVFHQERSRVVHLFIDK